MWTLVTILTTIFLTCSLDCTSFQKNSLTCQTRNSCQTEKDSLTKKVVYTSADKQAENEGGQSALMRQYENITLDSIPPDFDTKFIVAFIVETNGQITGEKIVKDKTGSIGQQMIKIAKSFRWTPAECDGKKIPMLVKLPLQICLQEE